MKGDRQKSVIEVILKDLQGVSVDVQSLIDDCDDLAEVQAQAKEIADALDAEPATQTSGSLSQEESLTTLHLVF